MIFRIWVTDWATTFVGSGTKFTWDRYCELFPSFRLTAHSSNERIAVAVAEDSWLVETMPY